MPTWLITGGAGFIGGNFVLAAIADGVRVVNLDALTYAGNRDTLAAVERHPDYVFAHGDIGDAALVATLLQAHRPDAVINFAAESHVDRSIDGPAAFVRTNVVGTLALLEAVREHWQGLAPDAAAAFRFLHVSTDEVYGSLGAHGRFTEASAYAPNSPYSASKAASDHLVRAFHHTYGLPVLTTHCSNNYGPYQFPEKLVPLMIARAIAGESLPVYGDGRQVRDWLHVGDHCAAIRAVLARGRVGETYNIGGDAERENIAVVEAICALIDARRPRADGRPRRVQIAHVHDRPGHDRRYAIDAGKLRDELGWTPAYAFEHGLAETVDWYLAHQPWVQRVIDGSYRLETHREHGMTARKGIILAGGSGTRLYPVTQSVSKQLLPVYNKPMIYYPLSVLMLAGIREVLVINMPHEQAMFKALLGDGSQWGMRIEYAVQPSPDGLAQAFLIGREFLAGGPSCLVLGDNIFHGPGLSDLLHGADARADGATVFGYWVSDPQRYGVAEFDARRNVIGIEEKPLKPRSNYAITGLYFYDGRACDFAETLTPSARGELEITDLNRRYLDAGALHLEPLGRGYAWLDTGTHQSLLEASNYIETIEARQGLRVCCPEEIAWNQRWIDSAQLEALARPLAKSGYGQYLLGLVERGLTP